MANPFIKFLSPTVPRGRIVMDRVRFDGYVAYFRFVVYWAEVFFWVNPYASHFLNLFSVLNTMSAKYLSGVVYHGFEIQ